MQNLQSESLTLSGTQAGRDSAVIPIASSSSAKFAGFTPQSFRMELNWFEGSCSVERANSIVH